MTLKVLSEQIKQKHIENLDISLINLDGFDFSGCTFKNVIFATDNQQDRKIKNINFKDAILENVLFDGAIIESCNFDQSKHFNYIHLSKVSFKNCTMIDCRFRKASIAWSDFRYSEISQVTFEESKIDFCDFYRTFFLGVGIFRKSIIRNSSFYYTYFDEGSTIRKENIADGNIVQQNKTIYRKFLIDWNTFGTGDRKNNQQNSKSDWSPENSLKARYADAEDIFKSLNGLWMSKGFLGDANWAYVQGKKMERKRMIAELTYNEDSFFRKLKKTGAISLNFLLDILFGYGESMGKMILTYILVIISFAYFYYASQEVSIPSYIIAIGVSFKNMVAMSPNEVKNISPFLDFLNVIQTTIGILLTGIFGFILGNKIRNQ
jgi:uncharacterized protein YjbI with pentapeptide repeats